MSEDTMVRTTVSIDRDIYSEARARMKALRIRKFSAYVALLIERDVRVRGPITVVKEEAPEYARPTRTLRVRQEHLTDRPIPPGDPPAQQHKNRSPEGKPDTPA